MKNEMDEILVNSKEDFLDSLTMSRSKRAGLEDFQRLKTLGTGNFGRVMLVRERLSKQTLAMKILDKKRIVRQKQVRTHSHSECQSVSSGYYHLFHQCTGSAHS